MTTFPPPPGTRLGTVTLVISTSAMAGLTSCVTGALLFTPTGSGEGDVADIDPPASVVPGTAANGRRTGIRIDEVARGTSGPGTTHVIGPAGSVPVQPDGKLTISTPTGGV